MPIDYELLGKRIAFYRDKASLSQEKLSDMLHVNRVHLAKIENGRSSPSPDLLVDIANALQVSVDDLLADSITQPSNSRRLTMLLDDCTAAEGEILVKNAENLKKLLDEYSE